jgi:hypothetical protein
MAGSSELAVRGHRMLQCGLLNAALRLTMRAWYTCAASTMQLGQEDLMRSISQLTIL